MPRSRCEASFSRSRSRIQALGELSFTDSVLRRKYLDYRSRQLAGFFVYVSADDLHGLARRRLASRAGQGELTYGRLVEIAVEWLNNWVPLPPFHVWLEDYSANPLPYESYFLGLWRNAARHGG